MPVSGSKRKRILNGTHKRIESTESHVSRYTTKSEEVVQSGRTSVQRNPCLDSKLETDHEQNKHSDSTVGAF